MFSRRKFFESTGCSALVGFTAAIPRFVAQTFAAEQTKRDARVLVVIELDGGNDGINTVVPFRDEGYAENRRRLRLRADSLLKLNDELGVPYGH